MMIGPKTHHLTCTNGSFFGHICSNVGASILSCESNEVRMDRWTDDFKIVCPDISVLGVNL